MTYIDRGHFTPSPDFLHVLRAVGWVAFPYAAIVAAPGVLENPATALTVVPLTLLAVFIFVAPLVGAHRILESQKRRLQDELGKRLGEASADLQARMDSKDFKEMAGLKDGIDSLVAVQNELSRLRTWPWQPGTVRGLSVALLLPVFVWIVQRLLERLGF